MSYGAIKRSRRKVEAAARRSIRRPGFPFPEHASKRFKMYGEVYRRTDGRYQGWVCLIGGPYGKRAGQRCGEAKGTGPTDALRRAALDFSRTLKGRG